MKSTDTPKKHGVAFAENGLKNSIPHHDSAGSSAASLEKGFPPVTMMKKTQGGLPPDGKDFNGIFNELSALSRWQSAGGVNKFDKIFVQDIKGYPKGALLMGDDNQTLYLSINEDNSNNPNTTSVGWIKYQDYLIENIPNASLTQKGVTQLSNTIGQDQNTAATPKLVNDLKNLLGNAAYRNIGTGANQIPDMSHFSKTYGMQQLPSGMYIQTGIFHLSPITNANSVEVAGQTWYTNVFRPTFQIPFPNMCESIICTLAGSTQAKQWNEYGLMIRANMAASLDGKSGSNTNACISITSNTLNTQAVVHYIAIGF